MADQEVVFKAEVKGSSLADLKKQFTEINKELSKAQVGTQEYQKTLEKLGAVKDEIGDLRQTINSLNPEGKVAAFQNVAGKLAGGFQAATGAAALFGAKSEELEKQLLKVQAATAFAQGIQSVVGLSDAFAVLKVAVMSLNPWLVGITVAVAAIAAAYAVWSENMSEAAKNDAILNAELERQAKLQDHINDELARQLELDKLLANSESERIKLELDAEIKRYAMLRTRQLLLQQVIDKSDEQVEELNKLNESEADSYNKMIILKIKARNTLAEEEKKLDDEAKARRKERLAEEQRLFDELYAQEVKNQKVEQDQDKAERDRKKAEELAFQQAVKDGLAAQDAAAKLAEDAEYNFDKEQNEKRSKEWIALKKSEADEEKRLAAEVASAKLQLENQSFAAAKALSDLYFQGQLNSAVKGSEAERKIRKKQFDVEKAFSIARATIDGIRAVQQALASLPPPYSFAVAAVSGVLAAANIAKIASTKFDGGASSAPSIPTANATVPTISQPSTAQVQPGTKLNPDGSVQTGAPVQAYVLEKDLTDAQKRSGRIQKQGKF